MHLSQATDRYHQLDHSLRDFKLSGLVNPGKLASIRHYISFSFEEMHRCDLINNSIRYLNFTTTDHGNVVGEVI